MILFTFCLQDLHILKLNFFIFIWIRINSISEPYSSYITKNSGSGYDKAFIFQTILINNISRFYPYSLIPYPNSFLFLSLILLYYKTRIQLAQVTWSDLISLSAYITRGKHRCQLLYWVAEPALLVSREYTDKTLLRGILGQII